MNARTEQWADALPAWSEACGGWPFETSVEWMSADQGRVTRSQYVSVVERNGRPVAAATWMFLTGQERRIGYGAYDVLLGSELDAAAGTLEDPALFDTRIRGARERLLRTAMEPCATVTIPSSCQTGVVWNLDLSGEGIDAALRDLLAEVVRAATALGARSTCVLGVSHVDELRPLREALEGAGYVECAEPAHAEIDIPASGVDGYLAGLSRGRREACRREMRIFAENVDRVTVDEGDRLVQDDMVELINGRFAKYGHSTSSGEVLDRLQRTARIPGARVIVAERDGRPVAIDAFVVDRDGDRVIPRHNAAEPNDFFAYFNVSYYEQIRFGAAEGLTLRASGTEAYKLKVSRGARLSPRSSYVQATGADLKADIVQAAQLRSDVEVERMNEMVPGH